MNQEEAEKFLRSGKYTIEFAEQDLVKDYPKELETLLSLIGHPEAWGQ